MALSSRDMMSIICVWLAGVAGVLVFCIIGAKGDFEVLGVVAALIASLLASFLLYRWLNRADKGRLDALNNGLRNLLDDDFSVSLAQHNHDDIDEILSLYNAVTDKLRKERQSIYQRELLLDTVIQNSSLSLVLSDQNGTIVYSNVTAEQLLNGGEPLNGLNLVNLLADLPEGIGKLIRNTQDGLFTFEENSVQNTYHLSHGRFVLNTLEHRLVLIKKLTRELQRQEINTWKKVIRVISHELNNSLAPISSMAHSGKLALNTGQYEYLVEVLETISERSQHLNEFVGNYAKMVKLPKPQSQAVNWVLLFAALKGICQFELNENELPQSAGYFDSTLIQQVLLNLLKNAKEAGSAGNEIRIKVWHTASHAFIEISDRGCGMNAEVMSQALIPFYTTKKEGSGIGLSLCREIVDLHDGSFSLENRARGGLIVLIGLPLA
jgi:nitrogen fixation/metabolism regulation signal transduction histidine kinase